MSAPGSETGVADRRVEEVWPLWCERRWEYLIAPGVDVCVCGGGKEGRWWR